MSEEERPSTAPSPAVSAVSGGVPAAPPSAASALLERAEQAHREGHFAEVRALVRQARAQALTPQEEERAAALTARFRPDPLAALLLVACLLLFALVIARYWN